MPKELLSLPHELQLKILFDLDTASLGKTCRVNKDLSAKATPIFWSHVELHADMELQQKFFFACDSLLSERPERWKELAEQVRSLNIGHIPTTSIPTGADAQKGYCQHEMDWVRAENTCERSVYDIISYFTNLEALYLYVQQFVDLDDQYETIAQRPVSDIRLPKLKRLDIGGCIHKEFLHALFGSPEAIEQLSCCFLQEGMAEPMCGPPQRVILASLPPRFDSLTKLHLCKLAEVSDGHFYLNYVDSENDRAVLGDWSGFLNKVSKTLIDLTLENRYYLDPDEGSKHSVLAGGIDGGPEYDWGFDSREWFQEIVLPVLADSEWPHLLSLTMFGMDTLEKNTKVMDRLSHLQPQVDIRFEPAKAIDYNYDEARTQPPSPLLTVDAPDGYFSGC